MNIEIQYRDTIFIDLPALQLNDQLVANGRAFQLDEAVVAAICSEQRTGVLGIFEFGARGLRVLRILRFLRESWSLQLSFLNEQLKKHTVLS